MLDLMQVVMRAAAWAEVTIAPPMEQQLARYAEWLRTEAVVAGGLGPHECDRIESRHLADSVCLAKVWAGSFPPRLVDVGSGVGLPGIPLAITHPQTQVTLLDRSGRRCQLLRRASRILRLANTEILQADADTIQRRWPWVVARAWTPPEQVDRYLRLLEPGGRAVIAGSHVGRPQVAGYSAIQVPTEVLASPAWILTMTRP